MALYRLEVKKRWNTAEWGNRYYVDAVSETAAAILGETIASFERSFLWNGVTIFGIRVSTAAQDGRTGRTFPTNLVGAVAMPNPLPIFNCIVMQLYPGQKQAGKKYYHFCLDGANQVAGTINNTVVAARQSEATAFIAAAGLKDSQGDAYTTMVVESKVGMHQMYRAWAARAGADEGD